MLRTEKEKMSKDKDTESEDKIGKTIPASSSFLTPSSACEEGQGVCAHLMVVCSILLILVTLPFSLVFVVKVVQEYERAVMFRLGLLLSGGARGPGVFFILPCVDTYEKVDMRTHNYEIPPQEVKNFIKFFYWIYFLLSSVLFDGHQIEIMKLLSVQ